MVPAYLDPFVGFWGRWAGLVFNVGLFGGLPLGAYKLVHWISN
jgi:hypothetical protein